MNVHIMGAACAGSTTLGNALAEKLAIPYFDTDHFFWEQSQVPYTVRRDAVMRNQMLTESVLASPSFIVGGSLVNWGVEWQNMFDLVVFLYVPTEIRLERLVERELDRYGDVIFTDPQRNFHFKAFCEWASKYDDQTFTGRNIKTHRDWLDKLSCKVIEIRGNTTVEERLQFVLANGLMN